MAEPAAKEPTKPATVPSIQGLAPQAQAELASLALQLADRGDPETRKKFADLVKKKAPQFASSFDDLAVDDAKNYVDEQLAKRDREAAATALTRRLEGERSDLIGSGRFDEDGIKKLEKFMEERGYGSYKDAAIIYAHENPPTTQRQDVAVPRGWELPGKDWLKDPKGMARKATNEAVADLMRKRA